MRTETTVVRISGVLLVLSGGLKFFSSFSNDQLLTEVDPILLLSYRGLFRLLGPTEILAGGLLLSHCITLSSKHCLNFLLYGCFLLYRLVSWSNGHKTCPCLGLKKNVTAFLASNSLDIALICLSTAIFVVTGFLLMKETLSKDLQ
jgi:hypothetical protein